MNRFARWLINAALVTSIVPPLLPQQSSAITGIVFDTSGARVGGARIRVTREETGRDRAFITAPDGRYSVFGLEPGIYVVRCEKDGFQATVSDPFPLDVDRQTTLNLILTVAGTQQRVEVNAALAALDPFSSSLSSVVSDRQVSGLPLNGRDYIQLATVQPGVSVVRARVRNDNTGYGLQLSIAGARPVMNNFLLDGISISDYSASAPASVLGVNLGAEAIKEFSVLSSTYGSQYGRAAGGIVNAVTKSGANSLFGSLLYFHRNDNLDARNFFDPGAAPEFRRHQYGASLGGPIKRNRLLFFADYEAIRQAQGNTTIDTTLSDAARTGHLRSGTVTVDPVIAKLLKLYPRPNGAQPGDTGLYIYSNDLESSEHFGLGRIDANLGSRDSLMSRYNISSSERRQSTSFQTSGIQDANRSQSAALEETHVFSSALLSQARLGFTRSRVFAGVTAALDPNANDPALTFLPGVAGVGKITVGGLTDFSGGTNGLDADRNVQNTFQFGEDISWLAGRHSLKFGGYLERMQFNANSQNYQSGFFQFSTLADFLQNKPLVFKAQILGSDTVRALRQWLFAGYVQDTWRVSDRFTLDVGVRYEAISVPTEANGKVANLDTLLSPKIRVGDPMFSNPSLKNFGPRIGFSWDVTGNARTIVRGGYGIYFDQLLVHYLLLFGLRNPPFFQSSQTFNLTQGDFPKNAYLQLADPPRGSLRVDRIPPDVSQSYVQHWNLHVIRNLKWDTTLRAGYIGSHGVHLSRVINDANLAPSVILPDGRTYFPANGQRQNPNFGQIRDHPFDGHSFYDALQVALDRRFRAGFQGQASYTWGKSIDDESTSFLSTEATNSIGVPIDGSPRFNRGLSNHDVRHLFTGSFTLGNSRASQ